MSPIAEQHLCSTAYQLGPEWEFSKDSAFVPERGGPLNRRGLFQAVLTLVYF